MVIRPKDEKELQKREAIGTIRASRFIRRYAKSNQPIDFDTICAIHREIFKDAWPEIAGKFRTENLKISDSKHLPCHHTNVIPNIKIADLELAQKLKGLKRIVFDENTSLSDVEKIVNIAAWLHHQITYIHPFRDGNGRTARLATNLILTRFGLIGISIKIEQENKNNYRRALAQIDQKKDYEPLMTFIFEGLIERYKTLKPK